MKQKNIIVPKNAPDVVKKEITRIIGDRKRAGSDVIYLQAVYIPHMYVNKDRCGNAGDGWYMVMVIRGVMSDGGVAYSAVSSEFLCDPDAGEKPGFFEGTCAKMQYAQRMGSLDEKNSRRNMDFFVDYVLKHPMEFIKEDREVIPRAPYGYDFKHLPSMTIGGVRSEYGSADNKIQFPNGGVTNMFGCGMGMNQNGGLFGKGGGSILRKGADTGYRPNLNMSMGRKK